MATRNFKRLKTTLGDIKFIVEPDAGHLRAIYSGSRVALAALSILKQPNEQTSKNVPMRHWCDKRANGNFRVTRYGPRNLLLSLPGVTEAIME